MLMPRQGMVTVSRGLIGGPEAKQPQEGTSHRPLSVSPDAKICTTGSPATGSPAGHFSLSCYFDTHVVISGEDKILGVTA